MLIHIKQYIQLTRAHIGIAVLPSFLLGTLFALILGYEFNLLIFIIGFLVIFLIYASASYINDYHDFEADKHNRQFGFSGGSGVLQKYPELKEQTRNFAVIFILISLFLTLLLTRISYLPWWSTLFIGVGAFFSWFYSAPPLSLSYKGIGELPHFIAGLMNTAWGYILLTGSIDIVLIIFAIPLSFHLLNVILIFEIPDLEADIHGGKTNYIVKKGRKKGFFLIMLIFWFTSLYFFSLAFFGWYSYLINFYLITLLSLIPSIISTIKYLEKPIDRSTATKSAIKTALSLFISSMGMILYFMFLLF